MHTIGRPRGRRVGVGAAAVTLLAVPVALPAASASVVTQTVIVSDNPVNYTPHVLDGAVHAITQVGNVVFVGGNFTQVAQVKAGPPIARTNFMAFDATNGTILPFDPAPTGQVTAIVPTPDGKVVAAGKFTKWAGGGAKRLVKFDPATFARVTPFLANTGGAVYSAVVAGSRLVVGGTFTLAGGQPAQRLAAFDAVTGARDTGWTIGVDVSRGTTVPSVEAVAASPDGREVTVVGNFRTVGGLTREQIARIDLSGPQPVVSSWATDTFVRVCNATFVGYMRDVEYAPDGSYFVVVTSGGHLNNLPGGGCDAATRWETAATGAGQTATWTDYTGGDTLTEVEVTGEAVYVGGHQRWMNNPFARNAAGPGAVSREGIAALDPENGMPLPWNPTRTRGVGVFELKATASGLYIGSDTDRLAVEYHGRIGYFPTYGGSARLRAVGGTLPGTVYSVTAAGDLLRRTFDGTTAGSVSTAETGTWAGVRGAFMLSGRAYTGQSDGTLTRRLWNGSAFGAATTVDLLGLTSTQFPAATLTGLAANRGTLFFTKSGSTRLYTRHFEVDGDIVGAETFTVSGDGDGFSWSGVKGMFVAGGALYWATSTGDLFRVTLSGNRPVPGSQVHVSGPSVDGQNWTSQGMFVLAPSP